MPFYLAYPDVNGAKDTNTEQVIVPGPTRYEYPGPLQTRHETLSGSLIVQQPLVDSRPRSWIWAGYPEWHEGYRDLWDQLQPLRSRYRLLDGETYAHVFLKEDESKQLRALTINNGVTESYPWLKVRVIEVSRKMRESGSSLVVYEETRLTFVIEDSAYNDLG